MKVIRIPGEFVTADGYPFLLPSRDKQGNLVPRTVAGVEQRDAAGNILAEMHAASFGEVLRFFVNAVFRLAQQEAAQARAERKEPKELTLEDSAAAVDIHRAIGVISGSSLALETHPYEWLEKQIETWGVKALGMNAAILKAVVKQAQDEEPNRAERRRAEKAEGDGHVRDIRQEVVINGNP